MEISTSPPPSTNPFAPAFTTTTLPNGTQTVSPIAAGTTFTLGIVSFDWDDVLGFGATSRFEKSGRLFPDHRPPRLVIVACSRGRLLCRVRVPNTSTGGRLITEAHKPSRYTTSVNIVGGRFPKYGKGTAAVREPTAPAETARPASPPECCPPG